ncbi:MAG: nucleic acid-binding protein [Spirochaetaceae bacterium]|nr:MAG: nucleic acid-binding protein [Spirochaetaceae bacterium]
MVVQDVIERLRSLQSVLSEKFRIESEIQDLPRALSTKTELVSRLKRSYIEKNAHYEEVKNRIRDLRLQMEEAERDREKHEQQMDQIKTQREYEALDKEIREASEREQNLRKDVQREEKVLGETSAELEREEQMIQSQEQELSEEQEKIKQEIESREHQLAELQMEEKELTPGLEDDLLFKFERIIRSKEGEGIVSLRKGVCTGCQMILSNQFVNDVRRGDEIRFCPYCSKIVFYLGEDEALYQSNDSEGLVDLMDEFADMEDDDDLPGKRIGEDDEDSLDDVDVLDEEPLDLTSSDDDDIDDEEELEEDEELDEDDDDFDEDDEEFDDEDEEEEEEEEED